MAKKEVKTKRYTSYYTKALIDQVNDTTLKYGITKAEFRRDALEYFLNALANIEFKYEPEEDEIGESKQMVTSTYKFEQLNEFEKLASQKNVSSSQVLRDALRYYLDAIDKKIVVLYPVNPERIIADKRRK